jgi:putative tricarboxylic transport membrane protein
MSETSQHPPRTRSKAGYAVGLGLLVMAGIIWFDTDRMQVPPNYSAYGPQIFPYLAIAALIAVALYMLWQTWAGRPDAVKPESDESDWTAVIAISVGLLSQVFLIERLGFVISAAILFFAVAWGFRSRKWLRDAIVAIILSLVTYLVFTRLLNLQLPPGIFKGVF